MWEAFSAVCRQRGRTPAADLIAHMTRTIKLHGGEEEKRLLATAEAELRTRRARKGGRPRKPPPNAPLTVNNDGRDFDTPT